MIDLHLHSTASDGSLPPALLVRRAKEGRLAAMALTDHDTLDGLPEAMAAGEDLGIEVLPGVEISLDHGPGTFHMIGLLFDPADAALGAALRRVRGGREERNRRLVERLAELGVPVDMEEVVAYAGGDVVARPHFAQALVARGYVGTVKEAFDRWLGKGTPGYVERERLEVEEAIDLVHGAGGVTVLCHPTTLNLDPGPGAEPDGDLVPFVADLAAKGLDAIEVRYSEHDAKQEAVFRAVAERTGLLESGGSDFHGHTKKDIRLGVGRGNLNIPYEVLDHLRERAESIRRRLLP